MLKNVLNRYFNNTFAKYFLIGISGALLDYSSYYILFHFFHVPYIYAHIVGSLVGFNNNFFLNAFFNFKTKTNLLTRYLSYFMICVFGMVVSSTFIYIMVSVMGFNADVSKILAMGGIFVVQYFLNKKITFK
ncbi:MAG: GtrA family protein [Candidatus Margulisbacteria bacterium]|nr:GtrA family protein [Candidatus Margulisiibacteriota bacterium]